MDMDRFIRSLDAAAPPAGLSEALCGLWWDGKGDWEAAHGCAQRQEDAIGAAVHAYLHRKEGDLANARGWYGRAGRAMPGGTLEAEWRALVEELLAGRA